MRTVQKIDPVHVGPSIFIVKNDHRSVSESLMDFSFEKEEMTFSSVGDIVKRDYKISMHSRIGASVSL